MVHVYRDRSREGEGDGRWRQRRVRQRREEAGDPFLFKAAFSSGSITCRSFLGGSFCGGGENAFALPSLGSVARAPSIMLTRDRLARRKQKFLSMCTNHSTWRTRMSNYLGGGGEGES